FRMKWVLAVSLLVLSVAAQQAQQPNKTVEGAVKEADGRRSHRRHRDSSESFEDDDYFGPQYYAAAPQTGYGQPASAPVGNSYGASQPAVAPSGSYGVTQDSGYTQYAPAYPQYPIYASLPPNHDVNYCSIHASFPMTGGEEEKRDRKRDEDSDDSDDYSRKSRHRHRGGRRHRNHRWNRQTCRFTATFSQETCQTCCRVSSRNSDSDPATITGALMFFAPWDNSSAERDLKREVQCVCCAPRRQEQQGVAVPVYAPSAAPVYPAPAAAPAINY
ncbi:hypothetical protein PENTCL1PPCAC_26758, partial [Pristionchus entomophagus]